eukprot:10837232-Prorocentrum_lima.AAC.1
MENTALAKLFQKGGNFNYTEGPLDVTGIQHVVHRLGLYFQEHEPEEILRVSVEYVSFSRGHAEAVEEAIA